LVEHATLDLGVVSLNPMLGVEITLKKELKKKVKRQSTEWEKIFGNL